MMRAANLSRDRGACLFSREDESYRTLRASLGDGTAHQVTFRHSIFNSIKQYIYIVITKLCAAAMQPRYVPVLAGYVYKAVRFLKRTDPNRRDFSFFSWGPPARELYLLRVCQ